MARPVTRFECRELCQSVLLVLVFALFTGMMLAILHVAFG